MISTFHVLNESWPEKPADQRTLPLDASRRQLAERIEKLVSDVRAKYADATRTTEFKRASALPFVEHMQKMLRTYHAEAVNTARETQAGIRGEIEKKLPAPRHDGREIRDAIAATDSDKRYLKVERAISEGDTEVLLHISNTPWVREDVAPREQVERARTELWEAVAPRHAGEYQRLEDLIPHHERLVDAAQHFVGALRADLVDEKRVEDRLSGSAMARQAMSAARSILGIAESRRPSSAAFGNAVSA